MGIYIFLLEYSVQPTGVYINSPTYDMLKTNQRVVHIEWPAFNRHLNQMTFETLLLPGYFESIRKGHSFYYMSQPNYYANGPIYKRGYYKIRQGQNRIYLMQDQNCPNNCVCEHVVGLELQLRSNPTQLVSLFQTVTNWKRQVFTNMSSELCRSSVLRNFASPSQYAPTSVHYENSISETNSLLDNFVLKNKGAAETQVVFNFSGDLTNEQNVVCSLINFFSIHPNLDLCQKIPISYSSQIAVDYNGVSRDFFHRFEKGLKAFKFKKHPLIDEYGRFAIPDALYNPLYDHWFGFNLGRILAYMIIHRLGFPSGFIDRWWLKNLIVIYHRLLIPSVAMNIFTDDIMLEDLKRFLLQHSPKIYEMICNTNEVNMVENVNEYCEYKDIPSSLILSALNPIAAWTSMEVFPNLNFLKSICEGLNFRNLIVHFFCAPISPISHKQLNNLIDYLFQNENNPWTPQKFFNIASFVDINIGYSDAIKLKKERVKSWFIRTINDDFPIEDLICFITGSCKPNYRSNPTIYIDIVGARDESRVYGRYPVASTCFSSLRICYDYDEHEYEQFYQDLKVSVNCTKFGFTLV